MPNPFRSNKQVMREKEATAIISLEQLINRFDNEVRFSKSSEPNEEKIQHG